MFSRAIDLLMSLRARNRHREETSCHRLDALERANQCSPDGACCARIRASAQRREAIAAGMSAPRTIQKEPRFAALYLRQGRVNGLGAMPRGGLCRGPITSMPATTPVLPEGSFRAHEFIQFGNAIEGWTRFVSLSNVVCRLTPGSGKGSRTVPSSLRGARRRRVKLSVPQTRSSDSPSDSPRTSS
jgi:hypothetical protein